MEIKLTKAPEGHMPRPESDDKLGFGKYFTDHMFMMDYHVDKGWYDPRIVPYGSIELDPAAVVLHYGQQVFEGAKAYRGKNGGIYLFRTEKNLDRMNRSTVRLCMPQVPVDFLMEAHKELILLDKEWIPHKAGCSLYIRPTMIATDAFLGVKPAKKYLFYTIIGPVGAYYPEGFKPTKMYVSTDHVRAVRGGVGETKTGGNYAASLFAAEAAMKKGFTQVLWLDAIEKKYVEEVGTSNIFFLFEDELATPPLGGTILPGITRDSVLQLTRSWGLKVSERPISMDEVVNALNSGKLKEVFGTGTAAVISPVGSFCYLEKEYSVAGGTTGELSKKLYDTLTGIQYGELEDPFGWVHRIG
ncbi:MAG: branched-chain amino acid aminotransferase [Deltaproteobacteria bacterium]|nr:branched-chain amino acid aminotransferase [Deltaproteobacteria bacterium]